MAYKANFEPNPELANLNPNRGTWERIEGKMKTICNKGIQKYFRVGQADEASRYWCSIESR